MHIWCRQTARKLTNPDFLKTEEYSKKQFVKKINTAYKDSGLDENNPFGDIQVVSQTNMGYVTKIQVGNVVMSGDVFAKILGLNSPFFAIKDGKITTKEREADSESAFILQILWHVRAVHMKI